MKNNGYPPGYTPPYKLLPYFVGLTFTFEGMAFAALGIAYQAQKGSVLEANALPAIGVYLLLVFVGVTFLSAYWVQQAREERTGYGRKRQPSHYGLERTGPGQLRPWPELPEGVAEWEMIHWLRKVYWSLHYGDDDPVTFSIRSVRDHPDMEQVAWSEKTTTAAKQWIVDRGWLQVGRNGHWELTALGKWALAEIADGRNLGVAAYEHPPTDDDDAPHDGDSVETDMT